MFSVALILLTGTLVCAEEPSNPELPYEKVSQDGVDPVAAQAWPKGCRIFALTNDQLKFDTVPAFIVSDGDLQPSPASDEEWPDVGLHSEPLAKQALTSQPLGQTSLEKPVLSQPKTTSHEKALQQLLKLGSDRKTFSEVPSDSLHASAYSVRSDGIYLGNELVYKLKGSYLYSNASGTAWKSVYYFDSGSCPGDLAALISGNPNLIPLPGARN